MAVVTPPRFVDRIPILKMPPEWFNPALTAVLEARGSRTEATRNVLERFRDKPGVTEKLAMRAFVVPTLTRLHFLRSTPEALLAAPNGVIWDETQAPLRDLFVGLCLRDFLVLSLGVPDEFTDGAALKSLARDLGNRYRDRLGGMTRLLRRFPGPAASSAGHLFALSDRPGEPPRLSLPGLEQRIDEAFQSYMRGKRVVGLDSLRVAGLREVRSKSHVIASSFRADKVLLGAMSEGRLCSPFASGTNALGELILGHRPFASVLPLVN